MQKKTELIEEHLGQIKDLMQNQEEGKLENTEGP